MTTQPATLLTANDADLLLRGFDPYGALDTTEALQALADGRTACVERQTEDEHRTAFIKRFGDRPSAEMYARDYQSEWVGYIACARANGLVKEKT